MDSPGLGQSDRTRGYKTAQEPFRQLTRVHHTGSNLLMETGMSQNRAASYTRVSPDSQQSVMAQLEWIRRAADEQGLTIARSTRMKETPEPRTTGPGSSG